MRGLIPVLIALLCIGEAAAQGVRNPDRITIYFPGFQGEAALAQNVTTYLSLQMAMTGRRKPWPSNPLDHDFGVSRYVWSFGGHDLDTHEKIAADAYDLGDDVNANIVVWGATRRFAGEVIADVNVTLPRFDLPGVFPCERCDFRQKNFETWTVKGPGGDLSIGPPRRRFSIKAVRLRADRVDEYSRASGLPIFEEREGGAVIGRTTDQITFLEFNPGGRQTPTKVRSGGVIGYVRLPGLSNERSVFQPMMGGVLQVFRGDWEWAERSFGRVLSTPSARKPIIRDALLYLAMTRFQQGRDGIEPLLEARRLAPYDKKVAQYLIMGFLAKRNLGGAKEALRATRPLFRDNDRWLRRAQRVLQIN